MHSVRSFPSSWFISINLLLLGLLVPTQLTGQDWTEPELFASSTNIPDPLSIAADSKGRTHVSWIADTDMDFEFDSVFYMVRDDSGWSEPVKWVCEIDSLSAWRPLVYVDQHDSAHVMWLEHRPYSLRGWRLMHLQLDGADGSTEPDTILDYLPYSHGPYIRYTETSGYGMVPLPDGSLFSYWVDRLYWAVWYGIFRGRPLTDRWVAFPAFSMRHDGVSARAHMVLGPGDTLHAVFRGQPGANQAAFGIHYAYKHWSDQSWQAIVRIPGSGESLPQRCKIAVGPDGTRHAFWSGIVGGIPNEDIYYSYAKDGRHWADPLNLTNMGQMILWMPPAVDAWGNCHLVFSASSFERDLRYYVYYLHGSYNSWSPIDTLFVDPDYRWQVHAALDIDPRGRLHLVMSQMNTHPGTGPPYEIGLHDLYYAYQDLGTPTEVASRPAPRKPLVHLSVSVFPNPFNQSCVFHVQSSGEGAMSVSIYNMAGQRVRTLNVGSEAESSRRVVWDGRDERGRGLASEVYFYSAIFQNEAASAARGKTSGKLLLLR